MGSNTELLAIDGNNPTTLLVLCGDKVDSIQAFRSGDFSVNMVRVNSSKPISLLTCMVGDHQWMLAKDSLVASVGERRFLFGLPGFFYGMELGSGEQEQKYETLGGIFARFCAYQDLTQIEPSEGAIFSLFIFPSVTIFLLLGQVGQGVQIHYTITDN